MADLRFGWAIVRHVKSNAIVLAKDTSLMGCGAGQMILIAGDELTQVLVNAGRGHANQRHLDGVPRFERLRAHIHTTP